MLLIQTVMLLTGLLMMAVPGACTRRQSRGDAETEKKTRTMGVWLSLASIIWIVAARLT